MKGSARNNFILATLTIKNVYCLLIGRDKLKKKMGVANENSLRTTDLEPYSTT